MTAEEICSVLREQFGEAVSAAVVEVARPYAVVAADRWVEVARFLRDDPRMRFNMLRCISGLDLLAEDKLACVYDLMEIPGVGAASTGGSAGKPNTFAVRVITDRNNPRLPSVASIWPAADWHEREAYDMFGIVFEGHPRLERILCPDDWEGYPLRKDYVFPVEYHGIPGTTEFELTNPRH
jgi:NADH-quinone oxidoreductase subunit C